MGDENNVSEYIVDAQWSAAGAQGAQGADGAAGSQGALAAFVRSIGT